MGTANIREIVSLPVKTWNDIFKRNSISNYLPYRMYDDEKEIFINNDGSFGIVFECMPRLRMGEETSVALQEIINKIPEGSFLQFSLIGSKRIGNIVEKWRNEHLKRANTDNNELLETLVSKICEFYYTKTHEQISPSVFNSVKDLNFYVSLTTKDEDEILELKHIFKNVLAANDFYPKLLNVKELKPVLYELLNNEANDNKIPVYDDRTYINKQLINSNTKIIVQDDCVNINGKTWISLTPQAYPESAFIRDFGEKIGEYSTGLEANNNQIRDSFIITTSIAPLPKTETTKSAKNHKLIVQQRWDEKIFRNFAAVRSESIEILDKIDQEKQRLFAMDINILVAGNNKDEAEENADRLISYWNKGGDYKKLRIDKCLGIHHLNFFASLPMGICEEYMFDVVQKFRSKFPEEIAQFIPAEADVKAFNQNIMMLTKRGQVTGFDLFKSNGNFNGYLVAGSGAGKSVLLLFIALCSYLRGDRLFVLDYDNSFLNTCEQLDGQYLNLDPSNPISFNPFSEIQSLEELKEDLNYFTDFIYMLGANKNQATSDQDEKFIKSYLMMKLEELYNEKGNRFEVTDIREKMKNETDKRYTDFAQHLIPFCKNGPYEKFLTGENQFKITKEFIVTEFKSLEDHPDIRDPLIMLLLYHINQLMYHETDREEKIQIILDEAHRFLGKNPRMDDFIEQAYRRARKYDASIILATQGFNDIYSESTGGLSKAGEVIIANSAWKFFMKQTSSSASLLLKSDLFDFCKSEIDAEILRSINTIVPQYSEVFVVNPDEQNFVLRLVVEKFFYYLTSTKADDKKRIRNIVKQYGVSKAEAIEIIIKEDEERK